MAQSPGGAGVIAFVLVFACAALFAHVEGVAHPWVFGAEAAFAAWVARLVLR